MSFTVSQLFPGIETCLNSIGFLFGAGASKEAGFPLIEELTTTVVENLAPASRKTLDEIIKAENLNNDATTGEPNIEIISDLATKYFVNTQESRFRELVNSIQKLIVNTIISVKKPDLTHHIEFLNALKQRAQGTAATVTVLTTNYDVLFELAAGKTGVLIETGFDGSLHRSFSPRVFDLKRGTIENKRFAEYPELRINLLKLHGSVSWFKDGPQIIESGIDLYTKAQERAMVLPRRQKVLDTLSPPFDQLIIRASRILGLSCKYIVSCGFSFGDQHINDQLIFPKLQDGKIRLTALCGQEPECLSDLKKFPAFSAGFPNSCYIDRMDVGTGTDLWKFSTLVKLLKP